MEVIKADMLTQSLAEAGFDLEEELAQIETSGNGFDLPRIRIEHKDNGRHRMYIDNGESYLDDGTQEIAIERNKFEGIVFAEQTIRALWQDGEAIPKCSAINDIPIAQEPIADTCLKCPESVIGTGRCKTKIRLWLLAKMDDSVKPLIFALSPTSIKHWNNHKKMLKRSKLPIVAVKTVFSLEDVKKNGYRWAEVNIGINGVADKEMLIMAKQYRDELQRLMNSVSEKDYSDPGDKAA